MAIEQTTPADAQQLMAQGHRYIDVRTEAEFANGHPAGAVNIPVAFSDPARGMMMNADFVKVVEANFSHDKKIVVGCQAGPRSNAAAGFLQQAGFTNISNMVGGFGGMRDPMGAVIAPGWATSGLPVSDETGEGVSYESLKVKIKK